MYLAVVSLQGRLKKKITTFSKHLIRKLSLQFLSGAVNS